MKRFQEKGATQVEYALLLSCLMLFLLPSVQLIGGNSNETFRLIGVGISGPQSGFSPIGASPESGGGESADGIYDGIGTSDPLPVLGGGTETTTPGESHGDPDEIADGGETGTSPGNPPPPPPGQGSGLSCQRCRGLVETTH